MLTGCGVCSRTGWTENAGGTQFVHSTGSTKNGDQFFFEKLQKVGLEPDPYGTGAITELQTQGPEVAWNQ